MELIVVCVAGLSMVSVFYSGVKVYGSVPMYLKVCV